MKLVSRGGKNYSLENLETKDFKWKNAQGRPGKNPQFAPQHYIEVWLDEATADAMVDLGFYVKKGIDNHNELGERPFVKFIIKPKMGSNWRTGEDEFQPVVVMKTPSKTDILDSEKQLQEIDKRLIETAHIAFHHWQGAMQQYPTLYLDRMWFTTPDSAGTGYADLDAEYGVDPSDPVGEEPDDEVPFR